MSCVLEKRMALPAVGKAGASVLQPQELNSASNHGNLKEAPELCRGRPDHTLRAGLGDPAKPCLDRDCAIVGGWDTCYKGNETDADGGQEGPLPGGRRDTWRP